MFIGIFFVIIFLSILILVHEAGHFLTAKKFGLLVEEFGFGIPPRIFGKKIGETIYSINALPFGGFVKIYGENREDEDIKISAKNKNDEQIKKNLYKRSFNNQPIFKRIIIVSAGVLMNFLFGWLIISIIFSIGMPKAIFIAEVFSNTPAQEIGLLSGDKIIQVDNIEIESADSEEFVDLDYIIDHINRKRGQEIFLKAERNGELIEFKAISRENPPAGQGGLGISLVEAGLKKQNIYNSLVKGFGTAIDLIFVIFAALFNLIKQAFAGRASLEQFAGPVGIVKITAQAGSLGFVYLLQLLSLISLNLAVINIFPFPALDGGRLIFLIIEKIKGSPLPLKFERYANMFGMILLLFLMIMITIKDIGQLF